MFLIFIVILGYYTKNDKVLIVNHLRLKATTTKLAKILMKDNKLLNRITINPKVCHGKPCIRNLRYPVAIILEYLVAGDTTINILAEFSDLGT